MTQNQFSRETIDQAINAIKSHESEIRAMKETSANMPLTEVAQTILIEKFGIAQIEASEVVDDINRGLAEFDAHFEANVANGRVSAKEQLADMTKEMSDKERINCYANILTALQLLGKSRVTQEEVEQLLEANSKKNIDALAGEIEALLNDGINLEGLAKAVEKGVNVDAVTEIAKHIEMNKEDYKFMAALWMYIAQREGSIKFSDSEIPLSAQMLGALSGASAEAILVTAELETGQIDMKRWQVVMKWILGALLFAGLLFLAWSFVCGLTLGATFLILELFGNSIVGTIATFFVTLFIGWVVLDKLFEYGFEVIDFFIDVYDDYIRSFTEGVKKLANTVKEWAVELFKLCTNRGGGSGGPGDTSAESTEAPTKEELNNGEELTVQPVMA